MTASEMFGVPVEGMPTGGPPPRQGDQFRHHLRHFRLRPRQPARHPARGGRRLHQALFRALPRHPRLHGGHAQEGPCATASSTTLFGRKIHFDLANARSPAERAFIERAAINAPIQGSAADIIRRAMIRMEPALAEAQLSAAMLLQVHDELIFEVPESEVEKTIPVVTRIMEAAAEPAVQLSVPLQVDARAADNWDAAH